MVVAITGPAAAGKSTIAKALQSELSRRGSLWLYIEIDAFAATLYRDWFSFDGRGGSFAERGFVFQRDDNNGLRLNLGPDGRRVLFAFHRAVAAVANAGVNVVCETIVHDDRDWEDWSETLQAIPVYWVKLGAPLAFLEAREQNRPSEVRGLARAVMSRKPIGSYHLDVDTSAEGIDEIVERIIEMIQPNEP